MDAVVLDPAAPRPQPYEVPPLEAQLDQDGSLNDTARSR
jgi:hypothetical protein